MKVENVKVRYLSTPGFPQRVLTIAFRKFEVDTDQSDQDYKAEGPTSKYVGYQFTLNRIVTPKQLLLDQRLRQIMTKEEFHELQRKFKKRFRGDQHNGKVAHQIAIGRLLENPYTVPRESEDGWEEVLHAMLTWAQRNDRLKYEDILYNAIEKHEIEKRNKKLGV